MRKPQSQPSLAGLTEAEREQIADWLRREEYDVVRDRVNKPRPEGFGLNISDKPLRTLWAKVALLDLINSRLPEGRKLTLSQFESLASRDISLLASANSEKIAAIHDTILNTVHDLATSGENTPTQLLALQRLADFPARAVLRAERAENDAAYRDHKIEMDTFRKEMAEKRFNLAEKTLAFRQQQHQDRLTLALQKPQSNSSSLNSQPSTNPEPQSDDLVRLQKTLDAVERRVCAKFNLPYTDPTNSNQSSSRDDEAQESSSPTSSNTKVPAEAAASSFPSLPSVQSTSQAPSAPIEKSEIRGPQSAIGSNSALPAPASSSPHSALGSSPLITDHAVTDHSIAHSPTQTDTTDKPTTFAPENNQSASGSPNLQSAICDLKSKVDAYTVKRAQEYWAYRRQYSDPPPPRKSHPQYVTQYRHCPCGAACPCPIHENKKTFGPFPNSFWTSSPHSDYYYEPLIARGLPYREPKGILMTTTPHSTSIHERSTLLEPPKGTAVRTPKSVLARSFAFFPHPPPTPTPTPTLGLGSSVVPSILHFAFSTLVRLCRSRSIRGFSFAPLFSAVLDRSQSFTLCPPGGFGDHAFTPNLQTSTLIIYPNP